MGTLKGWSTRETGGLSGPARGCSAPRGANFMADPLIAWLYALLSVVLPRWERGILVHPGNALRCVYLSSARLG